MCIAADSGTLGLSQNPPRRSLDTPVTHPLQLDIGKRRAAGGHRQNGMHRQPLSPTPACLYHPGPGASPTTLPKCTAAPRLGGPASRCTGPRTVLKFTFPDFAISLVNKFYQLITMESNSWLLYPKGQSSELLRLPQGPPAAGASFKLSEPLPQASPLKSSYSFLYEAALLFAVCPPALGRASIGKPFSRYPGHSGTVPCAHGGSWPPLTLPCCFLSSVN